MGPVSRRRLLEALSIVVASSIFALAVVPAGPSAAAGVTAAEASALPLDDAYIFIRFAQQLARGRGLEWTDGQGSSGATSLAYLPLLLPGQMASGLSAWELWSRWVGWGTLIVLGLAAVRLFRALRLTEPLPLIGGLTLVFSGPIGWGAVAGMESALNAAAVLWACALWVELVNDSGEPTRSRLAIAALLTGLLPLFRPENALLSGVGFLAVLVLPAFRSSRWLAVLALAPGALLALLNIGLTGNAKPAGALAKSITEFAFLDPATARALYGFNLSQKVLPAYTGQGAEVLWPPVGWITLLVAAIVPVLVVLRRQRARLLLAPALAWWVLFLAAPLSAMADWQYMRHHHAGLALAWVLAFAALGKGLDGAGEGFGRARSLRAAGLVVPALLLLALPVWRTGYAGGVADLLRRHGPAGDWLAAQQPKPVVLLNDAGYLGIRHDGPMIDIIGLGTPSLARPYRHGPGASVESLARLGVLPTMAAVNSDVFHLEALLGEASPPLPGEPTDTRLAPVRGDLLAGTALVGEGVDFAYLPSEEATDLHWDPTPHALEPSRLVTVETAGERSLQGCRPLRERVEWSIPTGVSRGSLVVVESGNGAAELVVRNGQGDELGRVIVPAGGSRTIELRLGAVDRVGLERVSPGLPCLESMTYGGG